jgi:CRISPR-associated protein Csb1
MDTVTNETLDTWAADTGGPVALRLRQRLLSADASNGDASIIFPPTYADIGYNIDPLQDGEKLATIDSVGSQAKRLELLFKSGEPLARLVPQITIKINGGTTVSIFDIAHRAADATMLATGLANMVTDAFRALHTGDAGPLCALAPTSLVFGVWDSRGKTSERCPRLVRSTIRAWDVDVLHAAAQFNSLSKKLDDDQRDELSSQANKAKVSLSEKGLADAPATFRKTKAPIPHYIEDAPNPEARVLGGVLVRGSIERDVTVNLVALRRLCGATERETLAIRRYLLGLTLLAATADIDLYLREGCLLYYADDQESWHAVPRRGQPKPVALFDARETIMRYTTSATKHFKPRWPKDDELTTTFDLREATKLLSAKTAEEQAPEVDG